MTALVALNPCKLALMGRCLRLVWDCTFGAEEERSHNEDARFTLNPAEAALFEGDTLPAEA